MANTMKEKPELMPAKCGIERTKPWFTPEANIMMLLGPGVMEVMAAKAQKARSWSAVMRGLEVQRSLAVALESRRNTAAKSPIICAGIAATTDGLWTSLKQGKT